MKKYQKAELIAKNLPTGSYAAGCPTHYGQNGNIGYKWRDSDGHMHDCQACELAG